jgi:hypothetical protein
MYHINTMTLLILCSIVVIGIAVEITILLARRNRVLMKHGKPNHR